MLKRKIVMLRLMLARNGFRRAAYLKKISYFRRQGDHCFFIPYNYGTEPHLLSFGDNVFVASSVRFVSHDLMAKMFWYMEPECKHTSRVGSIEVGSNVFIGSGATILYDVRIGDRVIVAAGTLVNRDLPEGGIYAGVPARRIGNFDDYLEKSRRYSEAAPWTEGDPFEVRKAAQLSWLYPEEK